MQLDDTNESNCSRTRKQHHGQSVSDEEQQSLILTINANSKVNYVNTYILSNENIFVVTKDAELNTRTVVSNTYSAHFPQ